MAEHTETLVAFTLEGEGLTPAFGDGEVIVAVRGQPCAPGARVIVELRDGSALLVRFLRRDRRGLVVAHPVTAAQSRICADRVASLLRLRSIFNAGHAPRHGIAEWRRLATKGSVQ